MALRRICLLLTSLLAAPLPATDEASLAQAWHELVSKHVDRRGAVSYLGFAAQRQRLTAFLAAHGQLAIESWSETAKKAVYINLYNAFMIEAILRYAQENELSLTSEKFLRLAINRLRVSGGNIWNGDYRVKLAGQQVNLDDIEHNLLRGKARGKLAPLRIKTLDPRIHMAVNCAARSCPKLRAQAYRAANVEQMLEENMRTFVNAGKQLSWDAKRGKLVLNKIILWYYEDFDTHGHKVLGKGGAGDYLRSYLSATDKKTPATSQLAAQLSANLNRRVKFALRFSRAIDFFYRWQINDVRNYAASQLD